MADMNISKLATSWTKYDIVRVMETISHINVLESYLKKDIVIDVPILRSFLGIKSLNDTIPEYWYEIQKYPNEKKIFALFSVIFTHKDVISMFAEKYSSNRGGVFVMEEGKMFTNIRSALVESGAALINYRRSTEVPYDFSIIFKNGNVGKLFKDLLVERISRCIPVDYVINDDFFYSFCYKYKFDKAIGLRENEFKNWLSGTGLNLEQINDNLQIKSVSINNFYSISEINLSFEDSKEIYLLGENGDGKSLILMAIYLAFKGSYIDKLGDFEKIGKIRDIINQNPNFLPLGLDSNGKEYGFGKDVYISNMFAYGAHRGRYSTDNHEEYGFMSLFDSNQTLINPVTWLSTQLALEIDNNINNGNKKLQSTVDILELILSELLNKHVEIKVAIHKVEFIEKGFQVLTFDQLSEGYKSILIFVCDLLFRMIGNVSDFKNFEDLNGIVLIDEIDLHLHLKWQRNIVSTLRRFFPNIQFIITTHSPAIIQGASDEALIYRVYRNPEDGKTKISDVYPRKQLNHLMINSLVTSPLFGLDNSRLDDDNDNADTSETYLLYRINNKLNQELKDQKISGKIFISDEEIDDLIQKILDQELHSDD